MEQRLQKLIASAGISSRRHAERLMVDGHLSVNGKVVTELGARADPQSDHIKVKGRLINPLLERQKPVYVLLNKPRGYLTSMSDPEDRPLVTDLVPKALGRLHSVGRLDFNTEGLLLLTTDGELTNVITAARNHIPKVYRAKVKGVPTEKAIERLRRGIILEEGKRTAPSEVRKLRESQTNAWFEVTLYEGRNQQIRRMFDEIGHSVIKLTRTRIGKLEVEPLKSGQWRHLSEREVRQLKNIRESKVTSRPTRAPSARVRARRH
ncbi:MAG: pseudouridine synthase [Pyrinomonadaceae bacterium]